MSERIQRVNQLIKRELSQMILKEFDFQARALVTITRVDTSSDLTQAKVYVSSIPDSFKAIKILNYKVNYLQYRLKKRLRMKIIPRIKFFEEKQAAEASRIEEILEKIHQNEI